MPIIKVNKNYQITIPASVRKELNISAGDFLEAKITRTKDGVVYKLKDLIDRDTSSYWKKKAKAKGGTELSEAGKRKVETALAEMEQCQTKEFDNLDDLVKDLNQ